MKSFYAFWGIIIVFIQGFFAQPLSLVPEVGKQPAGVCLSDGERFYMFAYKPTDKFGVLDKSGTGVQDIALPTPFFYPAALNATDSKLYVSGAAQNDPQTPVSPVLYVFDKQSLSLVGKIEMPNSVVGTFSNLIVSDSGQIIAAATLEQAGSGTKEIWLGAFGEEGALRWSKRFGWDKNETVSKLLLRKNGNLLLAGNTDSKGAGGMDMLLIETDKVGNLLWQRVYGGSYEEVLKDVLEVEDGRMVLVGQTDEKGTDDRKIVWTDKDGKVLASKIMETGGNETYTIVRQKNTQKIETVSFIASQGAALVETWSPQFELAESTYLEGRQLLFQNADYACTYNLSTGGVELFLPKAAESTAEQPEVLAVNTGVAVLETEPQTEVETAAEPQASASDSLLTGGQLQPDSARLFSLCVGVDKSMKPYLKVRAEQDAATMSKALGDTDKLDFKAFNPRLLAGQSASTGNIRQTLMDIQANSNPKDVCWVYLNMPTALTADEKDIILLTTEVKSEEEWSKCLTISQLAKMLNTVAAQKIIVLDIWGIDFMFEEEREKALKIIADFKSEIEDSYMIIPLTGEQSTQNELFTQILVALLGNLAAEEPTPFSTIVSGLRSQLQSQNKEQELLINIPQDMPILLRKPR